MSGQTERDALRVLETAMEPDEVLLCTSTIFGFGGPAGDSGFMTGDEDGNARLAASVFANTRDGIMITDALGRIIDVNRAFIRMTGYQPEEILGQTPRVLRSETHDDAFYNAMWHSLAKLGYWRGEICNRRKSGELFAEYMSVSAVKNSRNQVTHYVAIYTDISELKASQERLEHLAYHDSLTALPNRVLLADRIRQALHVAQRRGSMLAVCFADLDNFKPINDSFGHETGDRLLMEVSERLRQSVRGGDTVARIGGDEFAILLCDLRSEVEVTEVLGRILDNVARPYELGQAQAQVSMSIGFTLVPTDTSDPDGLLRHADQAMYQAKLGGRNRYHRFDLQTAYEVRNHQENVARMRQALYLGEFCMHYQPKVNLRTGRVCGLEALIRWQHPNRGMLLPANFLSGLGDHPVLAEIGDWAIVEVLRQQREWKAGGVELPVSINIAPVHLLKTDFLSRLKDHLASFEDIAPSMIEFEILETAALGDVPHVSRLISQCRSLGVEFSLDDFGTGYSSLLYLKRLPAQTLKIDRSFVRDLLDTPEGPEAMAGIVTLAEAFRRKVVAEGMEVVEQGMALLRLKCDVVQGFCIARPMPPEAVPFWVSSFSPDPCWRESVDIPWRNSDFPLLAADVEQRRWQQRLLDAVERGDPIENNPPLSKARGSRFGVWFTGVGRLRYGRLPEYTALPEYVNRINRLGGEIIAMLGNGQQVEAREAMAGYLRETEILRDALRALRKACANGRLIQENVAKTVGESFDSLA